MKKIVFSAILLSLICFCLAGCIHWKTSVSLALLHDVSEITSIQIYRTNNTTYNYGDPVDPLGEMLAEIPTEEFASFTKELTDLSFVENHLIILFPVAIDPNFYYGNHIVKVEYQDGSCELISYNIQRQFIVGEKYPKLTRYSAEHESWLAFLRNWADIP